MTVTTVLIRLLVLAVIFVNGWTDAPNAIATAVGSGALSFRKAVGLAAVCNFVGAALSCLLFPAVAATVENLIVFSGGQQALLTALTATMLSIILWAVLAWRFGLPTSESHALMAGLSGSALALGGQAAHLNGEVWARVGLGLALSLGVGAIAGCWASHALREVALNPVSWQRLAAAVMATLHGVQDGQKFMALLLLADELGTQTTQTSLPLILLCSGVMALGTALGGRPIIDKIGIQLTPLTPMDGLASDLGAGVCLLGCSLLGLPVSTTHTRVAAIYGVGRTKGIDRQIVGELIGVWTLTFPVCAVLSWLLTLLMLG